MDKFLENYVIKLTQKDLESLDSSITIKKFNLLPNTFLQTEFQVQMAYQTHRKKIMPIYHKIFEKTEEKEGMLTTHFFGGQNYPDTKTKQKNYKKRKPDQYLS